MTCSAIPLGDSFMKQIRISLQEWQDKEIENEGFIGLLELSSKYVAIISARVLTTLVVGPSLIVYEIAISIFQLGVALFSSFSEASCQEFKNRMIALLKVGEEMGSIFMDIFNNKKPAPETTPPPIFSQRPRSYSAPNEFLRPFDNFYRRIGEGENGHTSPPPRLPSTYDLSGVEVSPGVRVIASSTVDLRIVGV